MTERAAWRPMRARDLDAVVEIAARVHPGFPEGRQVFADRLRLHARGALLLEGPRADAQAGATAALGYCFAHPWHAELPPPLDTVLGTLPPAADALYLHDLALLPQARGGGAGAAVIDILLAQAAALGLERLALVAVNGSLPYWARHGFAVRESAPLRAKLASYGGDARLMVRTVR